jgi:hypothetical protein
MTAIASSTLGSVLSKDLIITCGNSTNSTTHQPSGEMAGTPQQTGSNPETTKFDYYQYARATSPSAKVTLEDFIDGIRSDEYAEKVKMIRDLLAENKKDEVNALKKTLPAISVSGTIREGNRAKAAMEGRFEHSGLIQIDLDGKDNPSWSVAEMVVLLKTDPYIQAVFITSSDNGVKGFARIPACIDTHKAAFLGLEAHFAALGLVIDPSCKDVVRLCFVSHDPEAWLRPEPALIFPVVMPEPTLKSSAAPMQPRPASSGGLVIRGNQQDFTRVEVQAMLAIIPPRPDYPEWLRICSAVWNTIGQEEGTAALNEWSSEESPGEYAAKYPQRLTDIKTGTLVMKARENGWVTPKSKSTNQAPSAIPERVFPVPGGELGFTDVAKIIFPVVGAAQRLFMRDHQPHEILGGSGKLSTLAPISPERFCNLIENLGYDVKRREIGEGGKVVWRKVTYPVSSAKVLLENDIAREELPTIRQLVSCPIFTKSGECLERGYHAHGGGTYITAGANPPEVPMEDARTALWEILKDFRFTTPADKSRAIASLLSPALKMGGWIDDDFPLDVAEADQSQSGKSYRQRIVQRIYNESPLAIMQRQGGVGGLDESISTALISGRPFIMLDNFRGKLDSPTMEGAIRGAPSVQCRGLRVSVNVNAAPFMWQLSTNGAELTRDLANRSIITRIRKQPAGYRFHKFAEGKLEAHVMAQQPFYLGCVFAILREWRRHGCPLTQESRHDFAGWVQALDWIIQNIFAMPPLLDGHREEQKRMGNPNLQWLRDVLLAARLEDFDKEMTTGKLVRIAEDAGIEFPGNPHSKDEPYIRVGRILGKLFREAEEESITVDGFVFSREERPDYSLAGTGENRKFYTLTKE